MLNQLIELTQEIGDQIFKGRSRDATGGKWEGDQLKTRADQFAHELFANNLPKIQSIPVVSEECLTSQANNRPEYYWLIDPIDGTRSLVDGFQGWVTQVALIKNCEPLLSVIFAPDLKLIFWAVKGQGSYCNGNQLKCGKTDPDRLLLIDNYPEPMEIASHLFEGVPCTGYVESGSISLKICRIADGTADLFVKDVPVRDWDIAAPMLVLSEAGGCLTTYSGHKYLFTGKFEKHGLIAARNHSTYNQCLSFLETRI